MFFYSDRSVLEKLKKDIAESNMLFDRSYKDILDNWDHYYQVYLDEVGDLKDV